jgi:hypothetical protein
MILQEAAILDALLRSVPAPRRLATVECGPWAALATTWAAGATAPSWTAASIEAVADAATRSAALRRGASRNVVHPRRHVPDTSNPRIASWRHARSTALHPLVARLIADFRDGHRNGK